MSRRALIAERIFFWLAAVALIALILTSETLWRAVVASGVCR